MTRRRHRALLSVGAIVTALASMFTVAPPASAVYLPINTEVVRTVPSWNGSGTQCTTWSKFFQYGGPAAQMAIEIWPECGHNSLEEIILVFVDLNDNKLYNVPCHSGYQGPAPAVPPYVPLGNCYWDGFVEQARFNTVLGNRFKAFGMWAKTEGSQIGYTIFG